MFLKTTRFCFRSCHFENVFSSHNPSRRPFFRRFEGGNRRNFLWKIICFRLGFCLLPQTVEKSLESRAPKKVFLSIFFENHPRPQFASHTVDCLLTHFGEIFAFLYNSKSRSFAYVACLIWCRFLISCRGKFMSSWKSFADVAFSPPFSIFPL